MSNQHMKKAILIAIASLGILCGFLLKQNLQLKHSLDGLDQRKEQEFTSKLAKEKQFIRQDLEEKYAADIVSYNAMAKRLEIEKKRVKELVEKGDKNE